MKGFIASFGMVVLLFGVILVVGNKDGGVAVGGGLVVVASAVWHLADSVSYALGAKAGVEAKLAREARGE